MLNVILKTCNYNNYIMYHINNMVKKMKIKLLNTVIIYYLQLNHYLTSPDELSNKFCAEKMNI